MNRQGKKALTQAHRTRRNFLIAATAITVFKILLLALSPANLGPDEAQYWFWSQDLAFGYFSKPPMIAWAIAATTSVFGDAEWAVRLSAPLFHFATACLIFVLARRLYGDPAGFWAGFAWLAIPGGILSSFVMTTDAPLLFFWTGALLVFMTAAYVRDEVVPIRTSILLGGLVGLAFLAKYAALYFLASLFIIFAASGDIRRKFGAKGILAALLTFAVVIAPNILWNSQNDFQTVSHTAANANWGASLFKPVELATFLLAQFGVFGPILFGSLIALLIMRPQMINRHDPSFALLVFAVTPLAIVATQSFISRAHANWAAAAYPTALILVTAWLLDTNRSRLIKASAGLHLAALSIFGVAITNFGMIDRVGASSTTAQIRGWRDQAADIAAKAGPYDAIVVDDRGLTGEMLYYLRKSDHEIVAIDPNANVDNHYEAFKAFDPDRHKRILFVTTRNDDAHVFYRFGDITPLGFSAIDSGGGAARTYHLFALSDFGTAAR